MAERDFLNVNDNIDFPFLQGSDRRLTPTANVPRLGLVDAGFLLGLDSAFVAGQHDVSLYQVVKTSSTITFYFRCNAPGISGSHWEFVFDLTTEFGCTKYSNAIGAPSGVDGGVGFLTVGTLSSWAALPDHIYTLTTPAKLEPALLQSLVNTYVRKIATANVGRPCPSPCCASTSIIDDTVYVNARNIVGDVRFKEGYNCQILVTPSSNTIEIKAAIGAGAGPSCVDLRVTRDGIRPDDGSFCEKCQDYISSISGVPTLDGSFQISGEQGMFVLSDPGGTSLTVNVNTHQISNCGGA